MILLLGCRDAMPSFSKSSDRDFPLTTLIFQCFVSVVYEKPELCFRNLNNEP